MTEIYEIVDATDDEMYFSMGFFHNATDAISTISNALKYNINNAITEHADDYEKIEIRCHEVNNLFPDTNVVFTLERSAEWNEEECENKWSITHIENNLE